MNADLYINFENGAELLLNILAPSRVDSFAERRSV